VITSRGALQLRNDLFDENFYKHHPVFALSGSVREICQPFFKAVNINYLDDCRVYSDNSVVGLSSDSAWLEHFFRRKFMFGCTLKDEGKHLWQTHQSHELLHEASYYHKHDHRIGIFYRKTIILNILIWQRH